MSILNIDNFIDFVVTETNPITKQPNRVNIKLNPNCILMYISDTRIEFTNECKVMFKELNYTSVSPVQVPQKK